MSKNASDLVCLSSYSSDDGSRRQESGSMGGENSMAVQERNTNIDKDDRGQDTYMSKDDQEQYKDQNDPTLADELWERLSLGMEEFFNFYNVLI